MRARFLGAAAAILLPCLAFAHDLWVERAGDGFAARYGHRGGEALRMDAAKVKAVRCADRAGAARDVLARATLARRGVTLAARCDAVSVFYHGGFYSLTPDGEVNLPRDQARDVVKAWESRQYAKWIDVASPAASRPFGDDLEIVPGGDLSTRKVGDKVTLKVLSQGKPVAGAIVALDHKPLGETDSAGEIRLRLSTPGIESVSASVRRPVKSPQADAVVLEASLTFEVAR